MRKRKKMLKMSLEQKAENEDSEQYEIVYECPRTLDSHRALRQFLFPSYHDAYSQLSPLQRDIVDYMELYNENARKVSKKIGLEPDEIRRRYRAFVHFIFERGINFLIKKEADERYCQILHKIRKKEDWN